MNLLSNIDTLENADTSEKDIVGSGYSAFDSGIYLFKVKLPYLVESTKGAVGLNLTLVSEDNKELKTIIYITSGKEKGKKTYYVKDDQQIPLPGFLLANSLAQLTLDKELLSLETSSKFVKVYDYDLSQEVAKEVDVYDDLIDQEVYVAITKQLVDKDYRNPNGETKERNEIKKFFNPDKLTKNELDNNLTEPSFFNVWIKSWEGKVENKVSASSGTPGSPLQKAASSSGMSPSKPTTSLFNDV